MTVIYLRGRPQVRSEMWRIRGGPGVGESNRIVLHAHKTKNTQAANVFPAAEIGPRKQAETHYSFKNGTKKSKKKINKKKRLRGSKKQKNL